MELPAPTTEEQRILQIVIEDLETRTPLQVGLAISVLRGHDSIPAVSDYLQVPIPDLEHALTSLWGVLRDANTGKLWIK